jgi:hypothetical protein
MAKTARKTLFLTGTRGSGLRQAQAAAVAKRFTNWLDGALSRRLPGRRGRSFPGAL